MAFFDGFGGDFLSAGAALGGGLLQNQANSAQAARAMEFGAASSQNAMQFSAGQAAQNRRFQSSQVARNRRFQKKMSSTQFQRGMKDMRKAGLNPILAYKQGGASSPSGGAASGAQGTGMGAPGVSAPQVDVLGNTVSSALSARRIKAETVLLQAQTRRAVWEGNSAHQTSERIRSENAFNRLNEDFYKSDEGKRMFLVGKYSEAFGGVVGSISPFRRSFGNKSPRQYQPMRKRPPSAYKKGTTAPIRKGLKGTKIKP